MFANVLYLDPIITFLHLILVGGHLVGRSSRLLALLSFHLLSVSLLPLEGNLPVDLVHYLPVEAPSTPGLLEANDGLQPHALLPLPGLCQCVHQSLTQDLLVDAAADHGMSLAKLRCVPARQLSPHGCLNRDNLGHAGQIEELFESAARFLFQEDLSKANLELVCELWVRLLQVIEDGNGGIPWSCVILARLSFKTRAVPPVEVLEHDANGVASFADPDRLEHASTSQLFQHVATVEVRRCEAVVGLDAADVAWG